MIAIHGPRAKARWSVRAVSCSEKSPCNDKYRHRQTRQVLVIMSVLYQACIFFVLAFLAHFMCSFNRFSAHVFVCLFHCYYNLYICMLLFCTFGRSNCGINSFVLQKWWSPFMWNYMWIGDVDKCSNDAIFAHIDKFYRDVMYAVHCISFHCVPEI